MRFAVAHKTSSYLMVSCAMLAMITGGAVSPVAIMVGVVGLIGSWWWEPPRVRIERWTLAWNLLSILVLVWAVSTAVLTGDFLGVGGDFLIWLVVAKAFNRRASRDWQQLYLLSFLMLVAGSVLNDDLTYGVAFLGFVLASTWALILSHLRREMEDNFLLKHADDRSERVEVRRILQSRRIVDLRFFAGTGVMSLGVFVLASALFLTIPRVGAGFFMKARQGQTFAGFSDGVKLGGHGTIKDDDTIVMRVEIQAPYRGRDAPYVHWRGVAFDEYSHGEWRRTRRAPTTRAAIDRDGPRHETRYWMYQRDDDVTFRELEAERDGAVRHHVWLEPLGSDVLFTASMPLAVELDVPARPGRARATRNDEQRLRHDGGIRYTVWSKIEPPPAALLRAAPKVLPRGFEAYLQLPPEITPRTRALARRITDGLTNDYDRARAIERWLRDNLSYTLELADPGDQEPVDFFLFDRKAGHCEYFASAFAILARAVGVPTRNVNGFLGGEWNEYDSYIAVRAGDAHSWNEVYFAGQGWVTFDATPASQDRLGRGGSGIGARLRRFFDTLRFQWFKWVVDYDLGRQVGFFKDVGRWFKRQAARVAGAYRATVRFALDHAIALAAIVVLAG
ncbi:MAG: DUF3488 domain-containing protein, partial [Myxococcales bacterium]|nr:DUF3488 domain-containing protein [Myxococcales bacterium]